MEQNAYSIISIIINNISAKTIGYSMLFGIAGASALLILAGRRGVPCDKQIRRSAISAGIWEFVACVIFCGLVATIIDAEFKSGLKSYFIGMLLLSGSLYPAIVAWQSALKLIFSKRPPPLPPPSPSNQP